MNLKKLLLHNWEAKVACLIIASAIWYVLRFHVITDTPRFNPIPASQPVR